MSEKIANFLAEKRRDTPFLVLDLDLVVDRYRRLKETLPNVDIYYAIKANPADEVVRALAEEGSCFDIASLQEMDACLRLGVGASRLSFGHTIKNCLLYTSPSPRDS